MKLHLPLLLLASLALSMASADVLYMSDGVNKNDLTASERFYDNGKGYYWTGAGSQAYTGARALYNATGSFAFMGTLEKRLGSTTFTTAAFAPLKADDQGCWYYTASNVLEYWNGTFGVFCHDVRTLPFGYTYNPDYADELAGTQSLTIGMAFYDNAYNAPGNFSVAADWFLKGTDDADCIRTRGQGGYFADYFLNTPASTYILFTGGSTYINERPKGIDSFQQELYTALGLEAQEGAVVRTHEGRIAYLGLAASDGVGHAITCYGFETDAAGHLTKLYITNSDDRKYALQTVYVKEDSFHDVRLYTDAACSMPWVYASRQWIVDEIAYINTPQKLEEMYAAYSAPETPLYWNGHGGEVWSSETPKGQLPDASAGWVAEVEGARYASFAGDNRILCLDDSAASGQISVSGAVSAAELRLENSSRDYVFSGKEASISAPVSITGHGSAGFNGVSLETEALSIAGYRMSFSEGAELSAGTVNVQSGGVLQLDGASAHLTSALTLGRGGVLDIASASSLGASSLVMQDGSSLRFSLSSQTADVPLLTYTGSVTLSGAVSIQFADTRYDSATRYALASFTGADPAAWLNSLSCTGGTLSVSNQVLYFTSGADAAVTHTWTSSYGTLKVGSRIGKGVFCDGDRLEFRNTTGATVTLEGEVKQSEVLVKTNQNLTLVSDYRSKGHLAGSGQMIKEGAGMLLLCDGNTYTGGTVLRAGTLMAMGKNAFGSGDITVTGGTLDLGNRPIDNDITLDAAAVVRNGYAYTGHLTVNADLLTGSYVNLAQTADLHGGTVSGTLVGKGGVLINGDVRFETRQLYTGATTIESGTLTLTPLSGVSGDIVVNGGTLAVATSSLNPYVKGITLNYGQTLDIRSGSVTGEVTAGYNAVIRLSGGSLETAPTLAGGTLDLGGSGSCQLTGYGATLSFGSQDVKLSGAGTVRSNADLHISAGTATILNTDRYTGNMELTGGILDLGSRALNNAVTVNGAAVVRGGYAYTGHLTMNADLLAGTYVNLAQTADLYGGTLSGTLVGKGGVLINGDVRMETRQLYTGATTIESGTLTLTPLAGVSGDIVVNGGTLAVTTSSPNPYLKGITLNYGQTLDIRSGKVTGEVTAGYNATIRFSGGSMESTPILAGGTLDLGGSGSCQLSGYGATLSFGSQDVKLNGLGTVRSNDDLHISAGTATILNIERYTGNMELTGGILDLGSRALNNAVTVNGAAVVRGGYAYTGHLTLNADLLTGSYVNLAQTADLHGGTVSGMLVGKGGVTVNGDVRFESRQLYTGATTIESGTLTLTPLSGVSGDIVVNGGTLAVASSPQNPYLKGITLNYGQTLDIRSGKVTGEVTAGYNATIRFSGGSMESTPILAGGTLDLGGSGSCQLSGYGATLSFGSQEVKLNGQGTVRSNADLLVSAGTVMLTDSKNDAGDITLTGGTLTLLTPNGIGHAAVTVEGGTLDLGSRALNNAVTVNGAAVVRGGYAYTGHLTVNADLLAGTYVNLAQTADLFGCTVNGTLVGKGGVLINGDVRFESRQLYTGETTIGSGTLTLTPFSGVSGDIVVNGGTLAVTPSSLNPYLKGITLNYGQTLDIRSGKVTGEVTAGYNAIIRLSGGSLETAPTLAGGTLDLGGSGSCHLSGYGATLTFGSQQVKLNGAGSVLADAPLHLSEGNVTLQSLKNVSGNLVLDGGNLTLASASPVDNDIVVSKGGKAVVNNGAVHHGQIIVDGSLLPGSYIRLTESTQRLELNGKGDLQAVVSGVGSVQVNAAVNAAAASLNVSTIMLNRGGELGMPYGTGLFSGREFVFNGGRLNCGNGTLTTYYGGTLNIAAPSTLTGNLMLCGGSVVFAAEASLKVSGTLTLSQKTSMSFSGNWETGQQYELLTFGSVQKPYNTDLDSFFGLAEGMHLDYVGNSLVLTTSAARLRSMAEPLVSLPSLAAEEEPEAEEQAVALEVPREESLAETAPEPMVAAAVTEEAPVAEASLAEEPVASAPVPSSPLAAVTDALVQTDWGIVAANRLFAGAVNGQRDSGLAYDGGQGALWVSALGAQRRHGHRGEHHGADHNLCGAAFGLEHRVGQGGALGLALGRTQNRMAAQGLSHVRQENAHLALYGQQALPHGFAAEGSLSYTDSDTRADFFGAKRTWAQRSFSASAGATHLLTLGEKTALRRYVTLDYERVGSGSADELRTGRAEQCRAAVGAAVRHELTPRTSLSAELSCFGDLLRHNPTAEAAGYRAEGAAPGRLGLHLTLGAAVKLSETWSADAAYTLEAAERGTTQGFRIGVRRAF